MSNVPVGYKQTDVGVIPEDWETDLVKNHCLITTGAKNTQDRIEDGQFPFFVRSQKIEKINSYSFDGEAVLTAGDGVGTGKVFHYIKGKFDLHQRVYKMSDFSEKLDGYFFYLYFSNHFYNRIMQMTAKSSVDSVRMEMIADMKIPLPPTLTEQTAIATALSDVDALLNQLDKLIAKKRDIKQATMQQLLTGKKRLAGFSGEWEVKKLGEVASLSRLNIIPANWPTQMYVHFSLPAFDEGKSPVVELGSEIKSNKFIVPEGTVLVSKLNPRIPRVWMPDEIPENSIASTEFLVLFPKNGISRQFLFILCKSPKFCEQMEKSATGTTGSHQRISPSDALTMSIFVPSDSEEQTAIATLLTDMDNEISQLQQRRHKTHALKQGMMQQLLTGKIRLVS